MERVFEIRTEPHRAVIGQNTLLFQPEADGAEFVSAYGKLQQKQEEAASLEKPRKASSTKHAKSPLSETELSTVAVLEAAMRDFLAEFLLPDSRDVFKGLKLPQRVLIELIEWVAELYGGGSGNPDAGTGTSTG